MKTPDAYFFIDGVAPTKEDWANAFKAGKNVDFVSLQTTDLNTFVFKTDVPFFGNIPEYLKSNVPEIVIAKEATPNKNK